MKSKLHLIKVHKIGIICNSHVRFDSVVQQKSDYMLFMDYLTKLYIVGH